MRRILVQFVVISLALSLSGCYFSSSLWKKHDEKAESLPTSPGTPDKLYVNRTEKKICISYYPHDATGPKIRNYLVVDVARNSKSGMMGANDDLQILKDIFSDTPHYEIKYIVANAQKKERTDMGKCRYETISCEESDFFILSLLGTVRKGIDYGKYNVHLYKTSENDIDSPIVLKNYNTAPDNFIYGAFHSNGRIWWIPIQGFYWDSDIKCDSAEWEQLPTREAQFDLFVNTSRRARAFDNPPWAVALGTPFSVALDAATSPFQIGFWFYIIFIHGMP